MFTFLLFILIIGLCFFVYVYLTNEIISQRKRIMLLIQQNNELKSKLSKLMASSSSNNENAPPVKLLEIKEEIFEEEQ